MAQDRPDLARLTVRAQLGDRAALEAVLRVLEPSLALYLRRHTADRDLADDLLQDTLVDVCRAIGQLAEPRALHAWAFRIAHRRAMRALKRRSKRRTAALLADPPAAEPAQPPDPDELERIWARIDRLPPNTRAAMGLHYGAGLSLAATAAVLGIPPGTAKSRIAAGLAAIRRTLKEPHPCASPTPIRS